MFDVFKDILLKKEITEEQEAKVSDWVLLQWLSGDNIGAGVAQVFNVYPNIPMNVKIKFIQRVLPGHIRYIKYPKKSKNTDKYIEYVSEFYNINFNRAQEYISMMEDSQLKEIKEIIDNKKSARMKGRAK